MNYQFDEIVWVKIPTINEGQFSYWPGKVLGYINEQESLFKIQLYTKKEMYYTFADHLLPFESIDIKQSIYINNTMLEHAIIHAKSEFDAKKQQLKNNQAVEVSSNNESSSLDVASYEIPNKFDSVQSFCQFVEALCEDVMNSKNISIKIDNPQQNIPIENNSWGLYYVRRISQMLDFFIHTMNIKEQVRRLFQIWQNQIIELIIAHALEGDLIV